MSAKLEPLSSGEGIQVVSTGSEHTFTLEEDALARLLLRDDVRERAVVVVSVAGAFRKGKSFLLDFFLRYLHHTYVVHGSGDWLGAEDEPLKGFGWRGGSERDTTGILLWSQPFFATLDNGEKVVIILMDTQGTFDSESTVKDCATVFALSTMLSSVQIYNLSQNIEEDDLQHLQLFTEYGRLAQASSVGAPFQHLQLLVRDWSFPYDYPYGGKGGDRLLEKRLEERPGQHEELAALRRHVRVCFQRLSGWLLPHPGLTVATSPGYDGRIADISPEFVSSLRELVPSLLAPSRLQPRVIGGQLVRGKDLMLYFKAYLNVFNGSELPEPKTILEATAEANNLSAVLSSREVYDDVMESVCGGNKPYLPPDRLQAEHTRARDKALHAFHSKKKMGGDELSEKYSEQLVMELEEQFTQLRAHNEAKNIMSIGQTAVVLLCVCGLFVVCGMLAGAVGAERTEALLRWAALATLILLGVWAYTRVTGSMREVGMQIDEAAQQIKLLVLQHIVDPYHRPARDGPSHAPGELKKES